MKTFAYVLYFHLVPLMFSAQYGNFKIGVDRSLYYEKVFEAPGKTAAQLQPLLVTKVSGPCFTRLSASDNIIVSSYTKCNTVFTKTKTALGTVNDGFHNFYGDVKIDIKDGKYRVKIYNTANYLDRMYQFEELYNTNKPSKHLPKLLQPMDRYFTGYYSIENDENW